MAGPKNIQKTRDLARTRNEILEVAFREVFARGFQGVSVDDIVKKTSLTKGAFYHHFPTKLDLGYALVEDVIRPLILTRWLDPLAAYEDPLEGILARLDALIGSAPQSELQYGCPLNNLVQEMAPVDLGFKERLQVTLSLWIDGLAMHLKRGKKSGIIRSEVNPTQAAQFIVMAHEGFYGLLKGLDEPRAFKALYGALGSYFEAIRTRR